MRNLLIFAFSFLALTLSAQEVDRFGFKTKVGQEVMLPAMTDLDGNVIGPSELRGKTTLLTFFGTRCPPCRRELPEIKKQILEQFDESDVKVVVVGVLGGLEALKAYEEKYQYGFDYVDDERQDVFSLFAQYTIPRNVVLDPEGKIVYQSKGYNQEKFENLLAAINSSVDKS